MKLLKYHQRSRRMTLREEKSINRKRKARETATNSGQEMSTTKQRKTIEILTRLADDRANEAFEIITSKLRTRDIYNLGRTNVACRKRIEEIMSQRKSFEFDIVSDNVRPDRQMNQRIFDSPDPTNFITNSIDYGPFNANTDICPTGLYYRRILLWKTKEEIRNTRSDYRPGLAARFLRYELAAQSIKEKNDVPNKHGFKLRDEYNGECYNQNYRVQIEHSKIRIIELFKPHLTRTKLRPLEEYFITDTMLGDFILILKVTEARNEQLVEVKKLFILNLAIQGCSSISFKSLCEPVHDEISNELIENYGIDAFSLQCDTIFFVKMRRVEGSSNQSTNFEITARISLHEDSTDGPSRFAVLVVTKFILLAPKDDTEQEFELNECQIEWAGQQSVPMNENDSPGSDVHN